MRKAKQDLLGKMVLLQAANFDTYVLGWVSKNFNGDWGYQIEWSISTMAAFPHGKTNMYCTKDAERFYDAYLAWRKARGL